MRYFPGGPKSIALSKDRSRLTLSRNVANHKRWLPVNASRPQRPLASTGWLELERPLVMTDSLEVERPLVVQGQLELKPILGVGKIILSTREA